GLVNAFDLEIEPPRLRIANQADAEVVEVAVAGRVILPVAFEQAEVANLDGRSRDRVGPRDDPAPQLQVEALTVPASIEVEHRGQVVGQPYLRQHVDCRRRDAA